MKCVICKKEIPALFLGKLKGGFVRKDKKLFSVCFECQSRLSHDELLKQL